MIISHTIKFGGINVKNTCLLDRANKGHQVFFGVLSIMSCATAVNDFFGVPCATIGVSCSTKCYDHVDTIFFILLRTK